MNGMKQFGFVLLSTAIIWPVTLRAQESPPSNPAADDPQAASLQAVLEKLSLESRAKLGESLASDWKDRPEWADMLIALLKNEKMSAKFGWYKPSESNYDWTWFAARFDANKDGVVMKEEMPTDTPDLDKVFARFDRDNDGKLTSADFDHSSQPTTPPAMMTRFLSTLLDSDSNGRITSEELTAFMTRADKEQGGFVTSDDLFRDFSQAFVEMQKGGDDMPGPETMLGMFFRGELGVYAPGPALGAEAPDFTLPTHDGAQMITLSALRGKPVILIFGSFT